MFKCKKISKTNEDWDEEIPWMTGYFTVGSWLSIALVVWFQMNRKLFKKSEKGKLFVEWNVNGLLRGNIKDRTDAYKTGINNGYMTINEVRRKENMNSVAEGNELYLPLNVTKIQNL